MRGTPRCCPTGPTPSDQNLYRHGANDGRRNSVDLPIWTCPLSPSAFGKSNILNNLGAADESPCLNLTAHTEDISLETGTDCEMYNEKNTAEKWFDESNKNVSSNRNVAFHDCKRGRMRQFGT